MQKIIQIFIIVNLLTSCDSFKEDTNLEITLPETTKIETAIVEPTDDTDILKCEKYRGGFYDGKSRQGDMFFKTDIRLEYYICKDVNIVLKTLIKEYKNEKK